LCNESWLNETTIDVYPGVRSVNYGLSASVA
jgi:hypothetical protein